MVRKTVEVEVEVDISDFSNQDIIDCARYRDIELDMLSEDTDIIIEAKRICQLHRTGGVWESDALELIYELSNKIV